MKSQKELVETLIKEGHLKTPALMQAFFAIDRIYFVPGEEKVRAYLNSPLPLGYGQTISQPLTVAFMLELLQPRPGQKILDVGSGSGWTTTLLSHIVGKKGSVFAIETLPKLSEIGKNNAEKYGFVSGGIAHFYCQDGTRGLAARSPFDRILASASATSEIPLAWREQLAPGGRIVAPIGNSLWLFKKQHDGSWKEEEYPGFVFVPLISGKRRVDTKQRKKKFWRFLFIFLVFGTALVWQEIYFPHVATSGTKHVRISQGLGSRKIGALLKSEGIIRSKWIFVAYVSVVGRASSLKPGEYTFGEETIPHIVETLVKGGRTERAITIPEGWSVADIAQYLSDQGFADGTFEQLTGPHGKEMFSSAFPFLRELPQNATLGGYLFPDTYRVFHDARTQDIIVKMLANFDKKVNSEFRQETLRQRKTLYEVVTMASLIEKEVATPEDRALVSGILWKRISLGIPLQVDATITYITGKRNTKISREDTKVDSPYNTYLYKGLPAGPIANPSLPALEAALFPKSSLYLYYLSAPDGRTIFSRTLEEHNIAKAKYLTK